MALITRTQVINAPIDAVFTVIVDGGNFAAWNPTIRSSGRLDAGQFGEGSRVERQLRGFGKVNQELQEFDRPRQVRIVPHTMQNEGGHRFTLGPRARGRGSSTSSRCVPRRCSYCSAR